MKCSTASRRTALGATALSLLTLLGACAETVVIRRTQLVPITRPETLSADCAPPPETKLSHNRDLPPEIKAWETALEDCNEQQRLGREFDAEVKREVEKLNKERSAR